MRAEFEIFQIHPKGSRLRIGESSVLDLARYFVGCVGPRLPGKYVIHDAVAGQDHVLTFEVRKDNNGRSKISRSTKVKPVSTLPPTMDDSEGSSDFDTWRMR
jgi:hypothetical protein